MLMPPASSWAISAWPLPGGTLFAMNPPDSATGPCWVGPADGVAAADAADPASVTTSGAGGITVATDYTSHVYVMAVAAGFGVLAAGSFIQGTATNTATALAYLGDGARLGGTGGGTSLLDAAAVTTAIADAVGFNAGLGFAVGQTTTKADLRPTVRAYTVSGGVLSGANVTVGARSNTDASGGAIRPTYTYNTVIGDSSPTVVAPAFARASLGGASLLGSVTGAEGHAINSPTVRAAVGSGTTVSATGALWVVARSLGDSQVDAYSLAAAVGIGVGMVDGYATSAGSVTAEFNGVSGILASANVLTFVTATALTEGRPAGGGVLAGATNGTQSSDAAPTARALVGGTLTASGAILIRSDVRTAATAVYRALSLSGFVSASFGTITATDETDVRTAITGTGSVTSNGTNVTIEAWHNFDGTSFLTDNKADASVVQTTFSFGLSIGSSNLHASAKAVVKAEVEAGATVAAPNGNVVLRALSGNYADSFYKRTGGALINVQPNSNPTSTSSGTTAANLFGHVNVNGANGAKGLTILAQGNDRAEAGIRNIGGGLIQIGSSSSTAEGHPTVTVTLGGAASIIRVEGAISAKAVSSYDADASTYSATGGALNVSSFDAHASMTPTSSAVITGGASIVAGGEVLLSAAANPPLPPGSDGTFDAVGGVDGTAHSITFGASHNATTGDTVTYNTQGQPTVSGLVPGRQYAIIVLDADAVQLGVVFSNDNVSTTYDTIDFGTRKHGLSTGDVLLYQLVSGTAPLTAIGGLSAGTL